VVLHYAENRKYRKPHCSAKGYNAEKDMSGAVGTGLEFYRQVLELRAYRQQVLTADISNASTPGFKAVDLDFREALNAVSPDASSHASPRPPGAAWLVDNPQHLSPAGNGLPLAAAASVKYQTGTQVTLDGNSVDLNQEKVAAADNAVQYEAAATFASQTVRMLMIAINGAGSQQSGGA
jgi:flagellar basal-body rod protein FlgB